MAGRRHTYRARIEWTGNRGAGTESYAAYGREHEISGPDKPTIPGSSDSAFRGHPSRWNPDELMVVAAAACHKLWYLHLCAVGGVVVEGYVDEAEGVVAEDADGGGRFTRITLRPRVTLASGADREKAAALHHAAHEKCFVANSVNFPIVIEPVFETAEAGARRS
jgi:organic hydroperoxide reductase OsmC/OhrA